MKKIAIICCYFGSFPDYFDLWMKSAAANKDVDFIIFTDNGAMSEYPNIKFIDFTLEKVKAIVDSRLNIDSALRKPYKLCDFKPVYGYIFEEYLTEYDFWGHCDIDLMWGNIRGFITEEILDNYDKILTQGHLCLYRNSEECNRRFLVKGPKTDCEKIFTCEEAYAFDERYGENNIYHIYKMLQLPIYEERVYADINTKTKRFRISYDTNYIKQLFYWEKGKVYQGYLDNGQHSREFIYLHFQKRRFKPINEKLRQADAFYICPGKFVVKEVGVIHKEDYRLNRYRGKYYEKLEIWFADEIKTRYRRLKRKIREYRNGKNR